MPSDMFGRNLEEIAGWDDELTDQEEEFEEEDNEAYKLRKEEIRSINADLKFERGE